MRQFVLTVLILLSCICMKAQTVNRNGSFDFSYKVEGQAPLTGKGTAVIKESCFHVQTNGLDVWCDGKTRWTVDTEAKEVYIEDAQDVDDYIQTLEFRKEGGRIVGADVLLSDGSKLHLNISNFKQATVDASFTPNLSTLTKDYVITDLR